MEINTEISGDSAEGAAAAEQIGVANASDERIPFRITLQEGKKGHTETGIVYAADRNDALRVAEGVGMKRADNKVVALDEVPVSERSGLA